METKRTLIGKGTQQARNKGYVQGSYEYYRRLGENIDRQELSIIKLEGVTDKLDRKLNPKEDKTFTGCIDAINNQGVIELLPAKDYGGFMGRLGDGYTLEFLTDNTSIEFVDALKTDPKRDKNEAGYDTLTTNGLRIQGKFRQWKGKTPYSNQVYIETTRRNSAKNIGPQSSTGHVAYSDNEFDALFIILADPNPKKRARRYWHYSCVPVSLLRDPNNPGFLMTRVPSDVLLAGSNWKEIITTLNDAKS
jgi:hypothetical protein